MKIDVAKTLNDIDGVAIPRMDVNNIPIAGTAMTVGDVLINAALCAPYPPGSERPAQQSCDRYALALNVRKGKDFPVYDVEIDAAMAASLKTDINRLYGPLVSGQILPMLDGK